MFTESEVSALIALDKTSESARETINTSHGKTRLKLKPCVGEDFSFILDITLNQKISFKVSMHHQEDSSNIGLIRVDYHGIHKNPEDIIPNLPVLFHPYAGKIFAHNEPHIHIYTCPNEYPILSWAIPLTDHHFPVKTISNHTDLKNALTAFAQEINLRTPLDLHHQMKVL